MMTRANAALRAERPPFQPRSGPGGFRRDAPAPATPELKALAAVSRPISAAERLLEAAVDHPAVLAAFGDWIERLEITDPDLAAIRAAVVYLSEGAQTTASTIDREVLSRHLHKSGQERAAARLSRWTKLSPPVPGFDTGAEWLAQVTREVVLPAIKEELSDLRARVAEGDDDAFVRFQALSREARDIEAHARAVKLDDENDDRDDEPGLASGM
jgi:hypothetical protein